MTTKNNTKYFDTLDNLTRRRYEDKIIGGLDPYELDKTTLDSGHSGLPSITNCDIMNYLVNTVRAYLCEQFKAYKTLESCNYSVCGWVSDVQHLPRESKNSDARILVKAKVKHSQRLSDPPLQPWVIAQRDGVLLAAHCTCMAGLGETCSHVGALLFTIQSAVTIRDSKTVTQEEAYWLMPSGISKAPYSEIHNINFNSSKTMKRKLDTCLSSVMHGQHSDGAEAKLPHIAPPTETETKKFLADLWNTNDRAVLLSVMPSYAEHYAPLPDNIGPKDLTELFDDRCLEMDREDLIQHCKSQMENIEVTKCQTEYVEQQTRDQSKCKQWYQYRSGRVTASHAKAVCSTSIKNPSKSLVKAICYPLSIMLQTRATNWGCEHEEKALSDYCEIQGASHVNFNCKRSGFIINPEFAYVGASPDAITSCDCCGSCLVEVKCPFCAHSNSLKESLNSKSCLELRDGNLKLKHSHSYYYQVQTQLMVCNMKFTDFVVWTEKDIHIERIEPDQLLCGEIKEKAKVFFCEAILPELVGKLYSRPQPSQMRTTPDESKEAEELRTTRKAKTPSLKEIICVCRQQFQRGARVVLCGNENCSYQWLHLQCMGLKRMPSKNKKWYCLPCQKQPA